MIIDLQQGSEEWHLWRKTHITASMAPIIMGVSKWTTPYQLFCEMTGLSPPKQQTEVMSKGLELEPIARCEVEEGLDMSLPPCVLQMKAWDWMGASLDGYNAENKVVLEIKLANYTDHSVAASGKVPDHYYPQVQYQMMVAQVHTMYYYSYRPEGGSILLEVKRDVEYCSQLLERAADFWRRLQECDPPDLTDRDYERRDDEDWKRYAKEILELQKQKNLIEESLEGLRKDLEELSNGKSCIGGGIRFSRQTRKGQIDYSRVNELKGVNLEDYRKSPVTFYRIGKE